jgi:hypothetical protein
MDTDPDYIEYRGGYNMWRNQKLTDEMYNIVGSGDIGKFEKAVIQLARERQKQYGGSLRDNMEVCGRDLLQKLEYVACEIQSVTEGRTRVA